VVEDSSELGEFVVSLLVDSGYDVTWVADGEEGFRQFELALDLISLVI
jgi:DNA-binding response OmpR family regulator